MLAKAGEGDRVIRTKMVRTFAFVIAFSHDIAPLAKTFIRWQTQRRKDTKKMIIFCFSGLFLYSVIVHVIPFFFIWQYYHHCSINLSTWANYKKRKKRSKKNRSTVSCSSVSQPII